MKNMYELVKEKDYFVVTTNGEDHFIPAGFLSERVFEMEGKLTEMCCSNGCFDEVYSSKETALQIAEAEKKEGGIIMAAMNLQERELVEKHLYLVRGAVLGTVSIGVFFVVLNCICLSFVQIHAFFTSITPFILAC